MSLIPVYRNRSDSFFNASFLGTPIWISLYTFINSSMNGPSSFSATFNNELSKLKPASIHTPNKSSASGSWSLSLLWRLVTVGKFPLFTSFFSRHLLPPAARLLELSARNLEKTIAPICTSRTQSSPHGLQQHFSSNGGVERRSEERRVGKECRSRWSPDH